MGGQKGASFLSGFLGFVVSLITVSTLAALSRNLHGMVEGALQPARLLARVVEEERLVGDGPLLSQGINLVLVLGPLVIPVLAAVQLLVALRLSVLELPLH